MKKVFSSLLIVCVLSLFFSSCSSPQKKYFTKFFDGEDYLNVVFENEENLNFAFRFMNNGKEIINKGVFYSLDKRKVVPLLVFDDTFVTDGKVILYRVDAGEDFIGWSIKEKTLEGYNEPFVYTSMYSSNGTKKEGPSFILNDEGKFEYNAPYFEAIPY